MMKVFQVFTKSLIILMLSAWAFAQTEKAQTVNSNKIAIVNSAYFYDEKLGINKLASAERQMGMTDCIAFDKYYSTSKEIKQLDKEIVVLEYRNVPIKDKLDELKKLKEENEKARKEDESCKSKIRVATVNPIIENIRRKLKEFAKQKGYSIVVDSAQDDSFLIIEREYTDITTEFIKYCNDAFDKEKTQ